MPISPITMERMKGDHTFPLASNEHYDLVMMLSVDRDNVVDVTYRIYGKDGRWVDAFNVLSAAVRRCNEYPGYPG